jgi:spore coat polysaccharide biosynthesis predicted glycosyltransferase SpsG/CMP-N-acetylneuraminic acid synthetase
MIPYKMTVLIPALKKTVAFQDDLVKKLAGTSLIQRAINKANKLGVEKKDIHLLTDSEEIRVIGERNDVQVYWDPSLVWSEDKYVGVMGQYLRKVAETSDYMLFLSPYAPLLTVNLINSAFQELIESGKEILKPIRQVKKHLFNKKGQSTFQAIFGDKQETHNIESKAFTLINNIHFKKNSEEKPSILAWPVNHDLLEIESYQDWWVCEKLLTRKRVVFRVIGNEKSGMGHIYRALSLAHEITDHEVLFVCDTENTVAVNQLTSYDYWLGVYEPDQIVENIINLNPDLVVNDILSTTEDDVQPLKNAGVKTINFEDLGKGAQLADLTINELYDEPQYESENSLWGHHYFFVRDEFNDAKPLCFRKRVESILLSFGGTDQHDLSCKVYRVIRDICNQRKIDIHIVTGAGYLGYQSLKKEIKDTTGVTLTRATGIISTVMEQSQIAIISNGRTVYELAHMNIPAIVISQHEREKMHGFACKENGFVPVGLFKDGESEKLITNNLLMLLDDEQYRHQLFDRTTKYHFHSNKQKVLNKIYALLSGKEAQIH